MKVKFIFLSVRNVMRYLLMLLTFYIFKFASVLLYIINPESASNTKIEYVIEIKLDSRNVFEKKYQWYFQILFFWIPLYGRDCCRKPL